MSLKRLPCSSWPTELVDSLEGTAFITCHNKLNQSIIQKEINGSFAIIDVIEHSSSNPIKRESNNCTSQLKMYFLKISKLEGFRINGSRRVGVRWSEIGPAPRKDEVRLRADLWLLDPSQLCFFFPTTAR